MGVHIKSNQIYILIETENVRLSKTKWTFYILRVLVIKLVAEKEKKIIYKQEHLLTKVGMDLKCLLKQSLVGFEFGCSKG